MSARRSAVVRLALGVAMSTPAGVAAAAEHDAPIQRPAGQAAATTTEASEPSFTSSPAPPSSPAPRAVPKPRASSSASSASGASVRATREPEAREKERLPHRGFTLGARVGAAGCMRSLCTDGHDASPGVRVDGFLGGNIRGFVDLGIAGGWGNFGTSIEPNTNLLRLYGIEPAQLQAAATAMGSPLGFNPFALQVQSARLRTARVGPSVRIHVLPRGRGIAYVGAGLGYSTFLADYDTSVGNVSMRFHGIDVPLQVGGGVQISEHVAAVAQFDFTFNRYPVARFEHPQESLTLPVAFLDAAARESTGSSVSDGLPRSWNVSVGLRTRF